MKETVQVTREALGDLPSRIQGWIGKARSRGSDRIELDFDTVELLVRLARLSATSAPAGVEINETHREFLESVEGVVEADSYASHMLWREYAEDARKFMPGDTSTRYSWQQGTHGYGAKTGEIGGRPVWISILCNIVNGQKLLFWHVTSPVADYNLCDEWLKAHLPASAFREEGYINRTDAMNFSNILRRPLAAAPAPSGQEVAGDVRSASQCTPQEVQLAALLAEVELEMRHCRVFVSTREKMHPTGIELYDQLHAKVNAALEALR